MFLKVIPWLVNYIFFYIYEFPYYVYTYNGTVSTNNQNKILKNEQEGYLLVHHSCLHSRRRSYRTSLSWYSTCSCMWTGRSYTQAAWLEADNR